MTERPSSPTLPPEIATSPLSAHEREGLRRGMGSRLPLGLVLLSLAFAVALPRFTEGRITALRNEINDVANPARQRVTEIQLQLVLAASQRRGYLLAGGEQIAERFNASRARRRQAELQLLDYTRRLDVTGSTELTRAATRITDLTTQLDSIVATDGAGSISSSALEEQGRRFRVIQALADTLGSAIDRAADNRRAAIGRTESFVALLTAILLLFGLGAAFLVARLGSGFRQMALRLDESEARSRQIAENERAARAVAEHRQQELERVTESRGRLIRGFTHDVRNPLGAADGYLALVEEGVIGDIAGKARATVTKVRRSIGQALELITQLLEIARAEAGELEIRPRETDVVELVRDVADSFGAQAEAKALALSVELPNGLRPVMTDPTRARQVVGNLVSNAVKYTPQGGHIDVRASVRSNVNKSNAEEFVISVRDDGPGISQDKLPMLFTEFTRFDPGAADGAGIGLAISQKVAQALGGRITVESVKGKGSTFSLHLPLHN